MPQNEYVLANTLSWAARNNIPYHEALKALLTPKENLSSKLFGEFIQIGTHFIYTLIGVTVFMFFMFFIMNKSSMSSQSNEFTGLIAVVVLFSIIIMTFRYIAENRKNKWQRSLKLAIDDLASGQEPCLVIKSRFKGLISEYFMTSLSDARNFSHPETMFTCMARSLRFTAETRSEFKSYLTYPFIQLTIVSALCMSVFFFIFPRFTRICDDISYGTLKSPILDMIIGIFGNSWSPMEGYISIISLPFCIVERLGFLGLVIAIILSCLMNGIFLLIILFLIIKFIRFVFKNSETILIYLPFIGYQLKKSALLEFSSLMYANLSTGKSVEESADSCYETCSIPWLKRRIGKFKDSVRSGGNWVECWEEIKLGNSLHKWLVRNSADREDPAEGFKTMSEMLFLDIKHSTRYYGQTAEIILILLNCSFIFLFIYGFFSALCGIIYYASYY